MQTSTIRLVVSNVADAGKCSSSPEDVLEPPEPPDISVRHAHPRTCPAVLYSDNAGSKSIVLPMRDGRGQGLHQPGNPYNIVGTEDFGLTSFSLSPTTSLRSYIPASTSAISLQLHASEKDAIALRPMSLGVLSLEDQRKHLLLDDEDERTPSRNYGGIAHTADLESNTVPSTRQARTKIDESDKKLDDLSRNDRLDYTNKAHCAPRSDCSSSPLFGGSIESATPSELEAGLTQERFRMAFTRVEMLAHLLGVAVVSLLIVLSMWLTIARVKM